MSAIDGNAELKALFDKLKKVYFIGSTMEKTTVEPRLGAEHDAVVFLEKTTGTKPN